MPVDPFAGLRLAAEAGIGEVSQLMLGDRSWMVDAVCVGSNQDVFFPENPGPRQSDAAKAICGSCPVRAKCLDYALDLEEQHGVWGGLTERERRKVRRYRPFRYECAGCHVVLEQPRGRRGGTLPEFCPPCWTEHRNSYHSARVRAGLK